MTLFFENATNAACPQMPSWHMGEVDYNWAKEVFRGYNGKKKARVKRQKIVRPGYDTFVNRSISPLGWQSYYVEG